MTNNGELRETMIKEWEKINSDYTRKLAEPMEKLLEALIKNEELQCEKKTVTVKTKFIRLFVI